MQVKDLIKQLRSMNPDAEVHFSYNYGDHWHTQVAPVVTEVFEGDVEFSNYHRMHRLVEDLERVYDQETGQRRDDVVTAVIIG